MWYKPTEKEEIKKSDQIYDVIEKSRIEISKLLAEKVHVRDVDTNFLSYYKSHVFCSWDELENIEISKIDVVIFSGYAGCGHFAPSKALAEKYSREGKAVIVIDPLFLYSEKLAIFNCKAWEFMSRHCQTAWLLSRKIVSTQIGTEIFYGKAKKVLPTHEIIIFLINKCVDVVLSCYPYANTIMPEIADHVKLSGVVVLDCSPIGFANLPDNGMGVEKIIYFVPGSKVGEEAKKLYPYIKQSKEIVNVYGTPSTFYTLPEKSKDTEDNKICLFIPGSGLGLGKGINSILTVMKSWEGKVIIVCGDNNVWIKKARKICSIFSNLYVTGYVKEEILKKLMLISEVIVAKPGASIKEEMSIISGKNVAYGAIAGQEVDNAKVLSDEHRAIWIRTKKELHRYLCEGYKNVGYNRKYDNPFATDVIYGETERFLS